MNKNLTQLFEAFKTSSYYNQCINNINLEWLNVKLTCDDIEELEGQIYFLLMENEEQLFINNLKYIWQTAKELSSIDS